MRALVLDADGVLTMRGAALPGAAEALSRLDAGGIPYRVATNISALHRETLAARFARQGLAIPPERIVSALSASADYVRRAYPGRSVFVLTLADGLREFGDQPLLVPDGAASEGAQAAAVVLGDAGDGLSFANLNAAFRLLRGGADLIAMHRNGWWHTADGETIDTGAFVAALEYATGMRAILTGKPAGPMFQAAFRGLAADVAAAGGRRLLRSEVAMVGDYAPQDILGARRAGLRGILVLSGRTKPGEVPSLRGLALPDAVATSVSEVAAALD